MFTNSLLFKICCIDQGLLSFFVCVSLCLRDFVAELLQNILKSNVIEKE